MRRFLAWYALALVTACGAPGGNLGGTGGVSGAGGVGGGAGVEADPPVVEILTPTDGETFIEPAVEIRGRITATHGLARLDWRDPQGAWHSSSAAGEVEFSFAFEMVLQEGSNRIEVTATDSRGDETSRHLEVQLDNPADRKPRIEFFRADPPYAELGAKVRIEWKVTGTRPIQLTLRDREENEDVSRLVHAERRLDRPGIETFNLIAVGPAGHSPAAVLRVGVGEQLMVWPTDATIAVGERQPLYVENAPEFEWTTSGGTLETYPPTWAEFLADEPGVYQLTVTTKDPEPRTVTSTIRVTEQVAPTAGLRGIGGQFGFDNYSGVGFSGAVDPQGTIWLPTDGGFSYWEHDSVAWQFVEEPQIDRSSSLRRGPESDLFATGMNHVLRLDPGASAWEPYLELPWGTNAAQFLRDGTLIGFRHHQGGGSSLIIIGATSVEEIPLPTGAWSGIVESDGRGGIYLATKVDGNTHVFHLADPSSEWQDTGPVPRPLERWISDLVALSDGTVFFLGDTLSLLHADGWQSVETPLNCTRAFECAIRRLYPRADGTLLFVSHQTLYTMTQAGTLVPLGEPASEMNVSTSYGIQGIFEAEDGTLVQGGGAGVFRLSPERTDWVMIGTPGIPPGNEINHLLNDQAGGLLVASADGGDAMQVLHRLTPEGAWEGWSGGTLTAEGGEILQLAQGTSGRVAAFTSGGEVYSLDWASGVSTRLPWSPQLAKMEKGSIRLAVSSSGAVFVDGYVGDARKALRLDPGSEAWKPDPSLPFAFDFTTTADGTLWAFSMWPCKLHANGTWQAVGEGLPLDAINGGSLASDGDALLLAEPSKGVFRLAPAATVWQRLGYGEPNRGADFIAAGGGRIWAIRGARLYELDSTTQSWIRVSTWLPLGSRFHGSISASPSGTLFLGPGRGLGLFQTVDRD